MSLAKGLNCGDRVRTTKEWNDDCPNAYEGTIDDYAPWNYNFLDILLDNGEIINIHVKYLEKCESS